MVDPAVGRVDDDEEEDDAGGGGFVPPVVAVPLVAVPVVEPDSEFPILRYVPFLTRSRYLSMDITPFLLSLFLMIDTDIFLSSFFDAVKKNGRGIFDRRPRVPHKKKRSTFCA